MVEKELAEGKSVWNQGDSAFTALLWLKRGLELLSNLVSNLAARPTEELAPCVKDAYETTLAKYHGWVTRQVFKVAFAAVPYRKDVVVHLGKDNDAVLASMVAFTKALEPFLARFNALFHQHKLNDHC